MKYWKLIVFVLIIIIVGIIVFFYLSQKPAGPAATPLTNVGFGQPAGNISLPNQTQSPTAFATNFYVWYLQGLADNQGFTTSDQFKSSISGWLTQDFASNWNTIAANTGSDPVLLAQDYQNSWATHIQTIIASQTATTSIALVSLGTSTELQRVNVSLVFANNVWRISAVTLAP